jgi:ATP-dependent DNA helicase RecQ
MSDLPLLEKSNALPTQQISEAEMASALATLGHSDFRSGQREAIDALMSERRLLLVAPTGGGKSLSYQLPGMLLSGTTVVISPLISLMHDQVSALEERGVAATFLASTLAPEVMNERLDGIAAHRYRLVYVAPERLSFPGFRALLRRLECPLVAIDEAHCISEWGHDFRPEYMQIGEVLKELPDARVLACTATATPIVRDEIIARLGLSADTRQMVHGFARPNLALRVREIAGKKERDRWVDDALAEALGEPGSGRGAVIIYSPTRRITEEEFMRLDERGWTVAPYHAGLEAEMRETVHRRFSTGELEVVVATNAFGMGIDRADVRGVIHLAPPGSVESYYQEVGRAGRDGEDAIGLMLLSAGDMPRRRRLIESDNSGLDPNSETVRHKWNLFLELMRFAEGGSCRHDTILRYFGDEEETLAGCGRCDVCLKLAAGDTTGVEATSEADSLLVRKSLAGVARVHGRFGLSAAVALLRGVKDPRLERENLNNTTTFGILRDQSDDWLTRLLRRCITAGWVDFWGGDRPVVILTPAGVAVMNGEHPVRLLLPPENRPRAGGANRTPRAAGSAPSEELSVEAQRLFDALRAHRLETARTNGVPPYVVASDRTLREIAQLRPSDAGDLAGIHGIGPAKIEQYGAGLLEIVRSSG